MGEEEATDLGFKLRVIGERKDEIGPEDKEEAAKLYGYMRVITSYNEEIMYRVKGL